jgi:uridine kinase
VEVPALSPARGSVLDAVAARVPDRAPDAVRVGVDGVDGVGTTVVADHLAVVLRSAGRPVVRISADDFLHPRAVRHRRGRASPEGFWLDGYDHAALRQRVLEPLGPGGSRNHRSACHDPAADRPLEPPVQVAPPGPSSSSTGCSCTATSWPASGTCRCSCRPRSR